MDFGEQQARLDNGLPRPLPPKTWRERLVARVDSQGFRDLGINSRLEDRPVLMTALAGIFAAVSVVGLVAGWNLWQGRSAPPAEELLPMINIETAADGATPSGGSETADADAVPEAVVPVGASGATGDGLVGDGSGAALDQAESESQPVEIAVHIAGAVVIPGVVYVAPGSRVVDAVEAGGGALAEADLDRLNLASPVTDGQQVYVPMVGEELPAEPLGQGRRVTPVEATPTPALIDLNTATELELQELPGIGPTMAAAIVAYRESIGAFISVDELTNVSGIGPARLESIRPMAQVASIGQ